MGKATRRRARVRNQTWKGMSQRWRTRKNSINFVVMGKPPHNQRGNDVSAPCPWGRHLDLIALAFVVVDNTGLSILRTCVAILPTRAVALDVVVVSFVSV